MPTLSAPLSRRTLLLGGAALWLAACDPMSQGMSVQVRALASEPVYRPGDIVALRISASRAARIVVLNTDAAGRVTVLWPNAFSSETTIPGGREVAFPPEGADWVLRVTPPAGENALRVIATTAGFGEALAGAEAGTPFARLPGDAGGVERAIAVEAATRPGAAWASAEYRFTVRP